MPNLSMNLFEAASMYPDDAAIRMETGAAVALTGGASATPQAPQRELS